MVVEDHAGRVTLTGAALPVPTLVTGVIAALLGQERSTGEFEVVDVCFADMQPQPALAAPAAAEPGGDTFVALTSGLNVSAADQSAMFPLQLFVDYVTGQLGGAGDHDKVARVARVVVAGNCIGEIGAEGGEEQAAYKQKHIEAATVANMAELDDMLVQLSATCPVDIMPGPNDPSNHILPQQALHSCMFPKSAAFATMRGVPNPYECSVGGVSMLGSAGQGVDDVYRFSAAEDRLEILERTLRWGHLFPTAPDTLGAYPFTNDEPFVLNSCPHVYFAGNQPAYQTKLAEGPDGQRVRLVCIPDFSKTGTAVLLNIRTLEVQPLILEA